MDLGPLWQGTSGFKGERLQEGHSAAAQHPAVPLRMLPGVSLGFNLPLLQ